MAKVRQGFRVFGNEGLVGAFGANRSEVIKTSQVKRPRQFRLEGSGVQFRGLGFRA